jgi:hypothetical protein
MYKVGDSVKKTMGCRLQGRVIKPISINQYTDGSYRPPHRHEKVVYVEWDDGTKGWIHVCHVEKGY